MSHKLVSAALCCLSFSAIAEQAVMPEEAATPKEKSPYTASAELGALFKSGDTKSGDIKTGLDFGYEEDVWKAAMQFDMLVKKTEIEDEAGDKNFETSDQKWTIVGQVNYTMNKVRANYIYGNSSYEDNRFSNFDSQSSVSAGWGRRWFETELASLDADIGPGFKRDVIRATDDSEEETKNAFIIQAQALYKRKLNEHVEFKQLFVAKYTPKSGENSTYKAETSITTKLIETLQLKFSVVIDYNSEVDEDKENTNTETAMTLVYSF